jgi:hypothetical protein
MASTIPPRETVVNGLRLGLSKEAHAFKDYSCPLLYLERRQYLAALRAAVSGVKTARVVLARGRQRIERAG